MPRGTDPGRVREARRRLVRLQGGVPSRCSSIRMSDCLVSRGLRVRFLPPAPTVRSTEPELKGSRTGSSWFQAPGSLGNNTLGFHRRVVMVRAGGLQMLRTLPCRRPRALPMYAPLAQWKSGGLRTRMRAFESPRGCHPSLPREAASGRFPKPAGPGSTPGRGTRSIKCRGRSAARMPACHAGDGGASPLRVTNRMDGWPSGLWRRFAKPLRT